LGSLPYSNSSSAAAAVQSSNDADISSSATEPSTVDSTAVPLEESSYNTNLPSATTSSKVHASSARQHPPHSSETSGSNSEKSGSSGVDAFSPMTTTSASHAVNTSSPLATPQDLATRKPPSTAAFAVPLSAIGAILVIAAGLAFRHRRKLGEERAKDTEKLALSRQSSFHSYKSAEKVQYALDVLSRHEIGYGAASAPVPLFMPMERQGVRREPRRSTKMAFAPASYVACTPFRSSESIRAPRSRPLLTRTGLSSRSDVYANDASNKDEGSATHSVVADYMMPSPPLPSSLLAAPQRVHVRNEVPGHLLAAHKNLYDDKPLPPSPPS
jgi:hypothetical protein